MAVDSERIERLTLQLARTLAELIEAIVDPPPTPEPSVAVQRRNPEVITDLSYRFWFSTAQAAKYAGVTSETISRACRSGALRAGQPAGVAKGHWRIHRDDLDAWLQQG